MPRAARPEASGEITGDFMDMQKCIASCWRQTELDIKFLFFVILVDRVDLKSVLVKVNVCRGKWRPIWR